MLAMSDVDVKEFIPFFADAGIPVAFLVPTNTGYEKSIMDATSPIRILLKDAGVHNYVEQAQGKENKVSMSAFFVNEDSLTESTASLYRPLTKNGDPRIWFPKLRKYCSPRNLLAIIVYKNIFYVLNLSNERIANSLKYGGFVSDLINRIAYESNAIVDELLSKIQSIHNRGFIPSITEGDPGVGDTLEDALGISRNPSKKPDYKGIELKASRTTRSNGKMTRDRVNLFANVPDEGMSYRQIVDKYGKIQIPKGETTARLQLYDTTTSKRANAYGLMLDVDFVKDNLNLLHQEERLCKYVSHWYFNSLRARLLEKHHETFWVKAVSQVRDGREYFRYDKIIHTKNPNVSLFPELVDMGIVMVDFAAHYNSSGKYRDHGVLFKMWPKDLPLLFGHEQEYIL